MYVSAWVDEMIMRMDTNAEAKKSDHTLSEQQCCSKESFKRTKAISATSTFVCLHGKSVRSKGKKKSDLQSKKK